MRVGHCGGTARARGGALQRQNGEWRCGCGTARTRGVSCSGMTATVRRASCSGARGELQHRDGKSARGELQRHTG